MKYLYFVFWVITTNLLIDQNRMPSSLSVGQEVWKNIPGGTYYFWCDNVLRIVRIMFVFEWPWCHWPAQPTETQVVIIKTSNPGPWLFHIIFLIVECWVVWMTGPLCCIMAYWWCKTGDINYTKTVLSAPLPSSRHSCLWSGQVVNKTANTGPHSVRGVCG